MARCKQRKKIKWEYRWNVRISHLKNLDLEWILWILSHIGFDYFEIHFRISPKERIEHLFSDFNQRNVAWYQAIRTHVRAFDRTMVSVAGSENDDSSNSYEPLSRKNAQDEHEHTQTHSHIQTKRKRNQRLTQTMLDWSLWRQYQPVRLIEDQTLESVMNELDH